MFSNQFLIDLIIAAGYLGIFGMIFAESGIVVAFFLPGDSLLFTAGFLASLGYFDVWFLIVLVVTAAILGNNFGYAFGRKVGPKIFKKEDSKFFHKDNLLKAEEFYKKFGAKVLVLARFIPMIRVFAPVIAGVGKMKYRSFFFYNTIGAILWGFSMPLLGYYLGRSVPDIDKYILPIVMLLIFVSFLPPLYYYLKSRMRKKDKV